MTYTSVAARGHAVVSGAMRRTRGNLVRIATLAAGMLPALALAHPGHAGDSSFAAGLVHPLGGIDHVTGFILIGLLAAQLRRRYVVPMTGVLLGSLVAAWTSDGDGWNYAAGFMLGGAIWIGAGVLAAQMLRGIVIAPRSPA